MQIKINIDKYKEVKKAEVRQERKGLLEKLDVEFMRAVEAANQDKQSEVAALKQALRDATSDPVIANATTAEQLRLARPAILDTVKNR